MVVFADEVFYIPFAFYFTIYGIYFFLNGGVRCYVPETEGNWRERCGRKMLYFNRIYAQSLLQSLDMGTDITSAFVYYSHPDTFELFVLTVAINLITRVCSTLIIYRRFAHARDIFWISVRQFLQIQVIKEAALSSKDGYAHHFLMYIVRLNTIFESVPQSIVGMVALLKPKYFKVIAKDKLQWVLVGEIISVLVIVMSLSQVDIDSIEEDLRPKHEGFGKMNSILRNICRLMEVSGWLAVWTFAICTHWIIALIFVIIFGLFNYWIIFKPSTPPKSIAIDETSWQYFEDDQLKCESWKLNDMPDDLSQRVQKYNNTMQKLLVEELEKYEKCDFRYLHSGDHLNFILSFLVVPVWIGFPVKTKKVFVCDPYADTIKPGRILKRTATLILISKMRYFFNVFSTCHCYKKPILKMNDGYLTIDADRKQFLKGIYILRFCIQLIIIMFCIPFAVLFRTDIIYLLSWVLFPLIAFPISLCVLNKLQDDFSDQPGSGFNEESARASRDSNMLRELVILGTTKVGRSIENSSLCFEQILYSEKSEDIELMIDYGDFDVNETREVDRKTLMCALLSKNVNDNEYSIDQIQKLLDNNADVNISCGKGYAAIHYAIINDNTEVATLLCEGGADLSRCTNSGKSPLHLAIESQNEAHVKTIANLLLDHNADINTPDNHQRTPLHNAIKWSTFEVLELLLLKCPHLVDCQDEKGNSYFHFVVESSLSEKQKKWCINKLMELDVDFSVKNHVGKTAYDLAKQNSEFIELLKPTRSTPLSVNADSSHSTITIFPDDFATNAMCTYSTI